MKRTWESPKLIVLVRNKPEEAVLSACKGYVDAGMAPFGDVSAQSSDTSCRQAPELALSICSDCQSVQAS